MDLRAPVLMLGKFPTMRKASGVRQIGLQATPLGMVPIYAEIEKLMGSVKR